MSLRFPLLACVAIAALGATAHAATPRTFDVVTFAPPDGFQIDDKSADHVSMTDTAPGRFGVIAVYAGRPATGDLLADFKTQWKEAVEHMMQPDATPEPTRGTMPGGGAVLAGSSTAKMDGKDVYARLFVIDGGAKVVSILVVTPGQDIYVRYEDVVNAMLAGTTVTKTVVPTPAPAPPPPPPPAPTKPGNGAAAHKLPTPPAPPAPPPAPAYKLVPLADDPALPEAPKVEKKQLVGDWQRSSGSPADKDSAIYGEVYQINAKGKFDAKFIGKSGGVVVRETDGGGYAYKDGRLLLLFNKRGTVVLKVAGYTDDKEATSLQLLPNGFPATEGNATIFGQAWQRPKARHGRGKH